MRSLPQLDIVIVSWKHRDAVAGCLQSLDSADRENHTIGRVVIVDNFSTPPIELPARRRLPEITLIANRHNVGFAAGCNQGAHGSRADYLLFLNPDTRVAPRSLSKVVDRFERDIDRRTGIIGLQIVNDRGEPEATCGRFLDVRRIFAQVSGLKLLAPTRFDGVRMTDWAHRETRMVDYVSAASLTVRRELFEQLGGFDERFFLYLEDADLALRARERGWHTWFVAADPVAHVNGWSTGSDRAWRLAQSWRSLITYAGTHLSLTALLTVIATVVVVGPLARLAHAVFRRSGRELAGAIGGVGWFWTLMIRDLVHLLRRQTIDGFRGRRPREVRRQRVAHEPRKVALNPAREPRIR